VQAGVLDLMLFCPGIFILGVDKLDPTGITIAPALYGFDAKVGKDKLGDKQLAFIDKLRVCGGDGWEFRSEPDFQRIFIGIIKKHYGTHPQTIEILFRISA
jgi:hypothetical protein